jgi:catechol 2,3-dioxygenase
MTAEGEPDVTTQLLEASPLWPATLDHIRYDSPDPAKLADFYLSAMGMTETPLGASEFLLEAPSRSIVIDAGTAGQPYSAFALGDGDHLRRYRAFLEGCRVELLPSPTALFGSDAFAVRDPDGRLAVFGTRTRPPQPSLADAAVGGLPGQLQHVVVASARFPAMLRFYTETLGFMLSDTVHQDAPAAHEGETNVCFLRADEMHHCFAVFRAPQSRADHHAYETTGWNDLKLWADHFASLEIPIWWGPGRHGAGNNLFFMIKDPDGNNIEISAELETMKKGQPGRKWMGARRATNLWGEPWIRDTSATS